MMVFLERAAGSGARWVTRERVRVVSGMILGMAAVGFLGLMAFSPTVGKDYAAYYLAGTILNSSQASRLYDVTHQQQVYRQVVPGADAALPYPYAPYFAVLMRPLAALPYRASYAVWVGLSLAFYLGGLNWLWRKRFPAGVDRVTALLAAAAFYPFAVETLLGGQAAAWICVSISLAVVLELEKRDFLGGLALSFCLFKPTLLVLLAPMLVLTGRYRMLAGFAAGAVGLAGVSLWAVGWSGCLEYLELLRFYGALKANSPEAFRHFKYVDLFSCTRLAWQDAPAWAWGLVFTFAGACGLYLARMWRRAGRDSQRADSLVWAGTLAWTPLLSPQCGVYDSVLLAPAVLLAAPALGGEPTGASPGSPALVTLVTAVFVSSMVSQPLAATTGVQIYTIALFALAAYLTRVPSDAEAERSVEGWEPVSADCAPT